jgi:hypothetical protein
MLDKFHPDVSVTGDKGSALAAVLFHNPLHQCNLVRGVKSARHITGMYVTNAAGEDLPPFYYYDSSA